MLIGASVRTPLGYASSEEAASEKACKYFGSLARDEMHSLNRAGSCRSNHEDMNPEVDKNSLYDSRVTQARSAPILSKIRCSSGSFLASRSFLELQQPFCFMTALH